jgi:hypothetical protein
VTPLRSGTVETFSADLVVEEDGAVREKLG